MFCVPTNEFIYHVYLKPQQLDTQYVEMILLFIGYYEEKIYFIISLNILLIKPYYYWCNIHVTSLKLSFSMRSMGCDLLTICIYSSTCASYCCEIILIAVFFCSVPLFLLSSKVCTENWIPGQWHIVKNRNLLSFYASCSNIDRLGREVIRRGHWNTCVHMPNFLPLRYWDLWSRGRPWGGPRAWPNRCTI